IDSSWSTRAAVDSIEFSRGISSSHPQPVQTEESCIIFCEGEIGRLVRLYVEVLARAGTRPGSARSVGDGRMCTKCRGTGVLIFISLFHARCRNHEITINDDSSISIVIYPLKQCA
ncbi:hypothetical protein PMAYCL1PPCAC_25736, partial [Pristionchus mayeri]